jgi:FkbM family methyltransferase
MARRVTVLGRMILRRFGVDVVHYPEYHPAHRRVALLRHYGIGVVFDVGANDGGYGRELRQFGYEGRIISFEPLAAAYEELEKNTQRDPRWTSIKLALGEETKRAKLNVAANSTSSSFLPMRTEHLSAAPYSAFLGTEDVEVARLDDVFESHTGTAIPFLKMDTQGFERQVLAGGPRALSAMQGVQLEMSLVPLYDGAWIFSDALEFLTEAGLELVSLEPGFSHPETGRLLQVDGLFMRPNERP